MKLWQSWVSSFLYGIKNFLEHCTICCCSLQIWLQIPYFRKKSYIINFRKWFHKLDIIVLYWVKNKVIRKFSFLIDGILIHHFSQDWVQHNDPNWNDRKLWKFIDKKFLTYTSVIHLARTLCTAYKFKCNDTKLRNSVAFMSWIIYFFPCRYTASKTQFSNPTKIR